MIHSDNMLGNGALSLGDLDFNTALEATGSPEPDRSFLDAAITASDINNEVPRQLEPVVNPMQRLTDVCLYNEDEGAAERVTGDVLVTETARGDVFGQNMLIGVELADMMTGGDVYETAERFIGALPREQQQAWRDKLNHCHTKSDGQALVGELFRNGVVEQYRANKARQETLEEERGMAFNGVFAELVKDANNEEAWNRFREGQARGAFTEADKKSLDSAAKAWGMMEMLMNDYSRSGAAVLLDNESGERIFNELYGDEAAQAVFLNVLNNEVQDLKNDASRRNALVRFGQAFAASTNNLMAGVIGGKFKAFVTDEQVDAYNREWERARERSGRENPNVSVYAEGDNWVEKYLLPGNARIDAIRKAAQESGQMNQDGSLRKMTAEERKGTQELGAFRGQLFNAVQGMYDVPGVVAKLGRMMPDSMIYLVPGGMIASAGSMHTQELARRLGEGEDYVSANTKAAVEAGISAAVEKLAFGSLKPARMAPGLDWLMSRKVVGQALGRIYGSTAGRIGLGVVAGSAEETFAEPLAGLIMRGVYNVAAADELQLADPLGAYRKEMEEMLAPDQILVTGLYGLLLGGVSAGGHMQAAEDYREMYEHLVSIGVDEGRAAQAARDDAAVAGFKATKALFDEAVKKDTKGVIAYLAELYPHLEPLNVTENLFSTWQLPHLVPAENGKVKVQEQDEEGKVTETLMSKEAADLLVQARLEQMKSSEIAKFANQLLGVAMAGKASSETDRFIVEEVDGAMDADYFTRLANAAGVRLQQGGRADEVDPEIHQHLTLGQLVQQGQAWEQRMEIQRNEVDQERARKNLPPLTDEEWAERKKAYVAAVNRQSVRGADGRKRTLLRVSRGHYGAMNVLEDLTEDFIARDMAANNRGLEWYVQNIRELETALGRQNEFLRELGEGKKPLNQMDVIEAVGKIAQSKLLADTVKGEHGFSAALKSFLEMIRTLMLKAAAMLKLGKAINQVLKDETARGKMDAEFLQLVDDVVAQDIEYLRELQLEDGLKAMQRVIAARQQAKADTRVKRRRKAKTPVLDKAEKNHGKKVREAARKKRRQQARVDADVEVAEAALEGDFSSSVVNQEELDAIKSATDNRGTFDGDEDAITMSVTDALTYEVVQKMNDPVLAIQETPSTYLVLLDVQAENKDGVMAPVVCAVEHKKGKDGNRYLVSAYSLDNDKETKITQQFKKLVYCKYNTTAKFTADAPQGRAYDLLRAAISGGHTSNVPCKEDVVKWQQDFSSSLVNLDEESVAREVVDAGQGFLANLAYSEAIMREMRGAMQRLRKLGSKTRTDREDAVAAMGTMVQMVKAAVAGLPKGYRFSVHPYLNRIEALAELAATGDIDLTSDIASKDILQLENAEGVDLKKPYDEMVKEYGNVKLAEALERIMHRVSEQLRKHAKDRAVEKITELVERLAPKKDPKTGKLKGGKMSADAYRDLATVDKAMKMNAEQLEAKLTALRADLAKPGISEVLRGELEDKMTLYDQFGDLAGMTPEDAVAAYEVLRVRVYFHRFEWEDKQARVRGARRAVVRRVVDGVGTVSENEYNAKKRRVKPTKRLKNLGDILSGMPAALAGLRGYLPLRQMADELALRANAAGEAIKAWEAERWLALEALSKETMGKSWRECMDFMHKVQPSGVSFDRPKFRTVNVKTEELRELLAMTKEERKAEMKRRRESGGLEAERALSERDVQELQKKLEAMEEEDRVLSRVETRYMVEVQHEENLQLSRGEALYAILMFEQPTYTERLIMQGYTFEVIAGLREYVGDGMLQFGYGLRELFAKQGDRIAAVYEKAFGVPFPREENYFAARWVVNGTKESPAEQLLAGMAGTAGAGNGWMKQRVNHNLELDMTKDALQVFLQATSLTDTWIATQDIVADFKAWTRDADFERALTAVLGQESYDNLKDWIRILEMGGVQDCLNMGVSQDVINGLYGSGAVAILGLRVQTLLKQTPAIFNGLLGAHDISAAEWFATLSKMKKGDAPMTYSRMVNSTLMKMRQQGKAGNMAGQAVRSGDTASSAAEGLLQASMLPMEWVDARCTAMGLVPVWNVYYQRAVNQGASHEEAERAAWEQTALVANLSSQPIGWLNKIKIAQSRNPIVKSAFYMLSENTAKFALCRALWRGGKKMAAFRAWLVYGAANAAISAMLDALQGDPEEFEKGKWWEYALSAFYGPASGIPGVGEALEAAVNALLNLTGEVADIDWMKKVKTRASAGRALVDIQGSAKALERVWGYMTDNKEHSLAEYTRAVGTVSRTLAIGTGWMGNMFGYWSTAVAVLMNPIDFGARVWRNMKHYAEE